MMLFSRKFIVACLVTLLLVNTAIISYAADSTEFREITASEVNPAADTFFGVGDYLAAVVSSQNKMIFYSLEGYKPVKVFEGDNRENARWNGYAEREIDNGATNGCFAAIEGKYAVYDSEFNRLTPNQYTSIDFYGKLAVGEYNYGGLLTEGHDLIDLSNGKILVHERIDTPSDVSRRMIVSDDGQFFQSAYSIWNSNGKMIFSTDKAYISDISMTRLQKNDFLWIGIINIDTENEKFALFHGQSRISAEYDQVESEYFDVDADQTGLIVFKQGDDHVLVDTDGNEIIKSKSEIRILSSGLAMIEDTAGIHYYTAQGSATEFDQYAAVKSLYDRQTSYLIVQSAENGKWGVVDSSGNIIIPVQYDAIEGLNDENGGVCSLKNGESYEIWNIAAQKQLFVSSDNNWFRADESYNLKYVPSGWIAHTSGHAGNTEAVRNLYDASGRLLHENIRKTFNINNKIYYAKAISLKSGQYQEALVDEYNRVVFTAPVGRYIQKASSNVIITSWWNAGTTTQQIFIRTASDSSKNTGTKSALLQIIPFDTTSVLTASRLVSLLSQHGIVQVVH